MMKLTFEPHGLCALIAEFIVVYKCAWADADPTTELKKVEETINGY